MAILSIQSHVSYGYVGNTAATFPLQRLGREVWAVNTVEFSNHTGYGSWKGRVLDAQLIEDLVTGMEERGILGECEAVLSGYMGDPGIGMAIVETVRKIRGIVPGLIYCCDPVMGDVGRGFYVHKEIPKVLKEMALPAATILTPNQFELEALTGLQCAGIEDAHRAVNMLHNQGPQIVLVTSYKDGDTADNHLSILASNGSELYRVTTPELPNTAVAGAGDMTAAVFLSRYLESGDLQKALGLTGASVFSIIQATVSAGSKELHIVKAQGELTEPSHSFAVEKL